MIKKILCLPIFAGLSELEQANIIEILKDNL
jgi:dTDP-4-amino-4,6-dideoxygalactose transaminase